VQDEALAGVFVLLAPAALEAHRHAGTRRPRASIASRTTRKPRAS
jgi:hypothetical protein